MLILSRKLDESIIINGNIEIKIVSIDDARVRIGVSAPANVEVHRKEVFERIKEENLQAAKTANGLEALRTIKKPE